ncbi:16S rRNA processing protein RimM [Sphingorhabdus soli]|uniref:Ribosome maturation factor RimM n=1 Tax=Flavisphingopyxis soli TaxID=2601267 RepID=A0A5C6U9W7_9SPHN|nr:16S rRNA processing protein RimM [Sphingorhabdus soli]
MPKPTPHPAGSEPSGRAPHPDGPPQTPPASGRGLNRRVVLAAISGAHGVAGEVRLKLFADGPDSLKRYGSFEVDGRTLTLTKIRPANHGAVARFAEIADRTGAEAMRGTVLTVARSALPALEEGEYYHHDLIDLPCVSSDGETLGTCVAVENFNAGDVVEIERENGKRFMVPIAAVTVGETQLTIDSDFVE